jgi:hypothetical protein
MATLPDYSIDVAQPFVEATRGYQLGMNQELFLQNLQAQRQAQAEQRQAQMLAQQQAEQRQAQLNNAVGQLMSNQNPTARDFINVSMLLPEKEAASMRANWETLSKEQQQNELRFTGEVVSAFNSGQAQVGIDRLKQRADAERNAGRPDKAQFFETQAKLAELDPAAAKTTIGTLLGVVPGGKEILDMSIKAMGAPAELAAGAAEAQTKAAGARIKQLEAANTPQRLYLENNKTQTDVRNIDSQIADRANRLVLDRQRLDLDRDKLQSDVELKLMELGQAGEKLDPSATKIVNESTVAAVSAAQTSRQMMGLADKLEKEGGGYGALGSPSRWYEAATGSNESWKQTRQEYIRIRNSEAIKSLPQGSATDADIQMALQPFPSENARAPQVASFLRGMAKLKQYESAFEGAKAEWTNANGSLGSSKRDLQIGNVQVPKGYTFVDYAAQSMDKRASDIAAQQTQQATQGRSYMRWAK